MIPVTWRNIKSWTCVECGMCCIKYHVVLNFKEWIDIIRNYGVDSTTPSINKLLLGKKGDGTCQFLINIKSNCFCGLQSKKPLACKIWPFKILKYPKFGFPNEAKYYFRNQEFFIYVDPACNGLVLGKPTPFFKNQILAEFVEVAVGLCRRQFYSTAKINFQSIVGQFESKNRF